MGALLILAAIGDAYWERDVSGLASECSPPPPPRAAAFSCAAHSSCRTNLVQGHSPSADGHAAEIDTADMGVAAYNPFGELRAKLLFLFV